MRERTKAYAAGLMDAEGCFSIYKPSTTPGKRTSFQPRIVMSSVDLPIIKWMVANFGGFFTKHVPKKGQVWYQWNLNSKKSAPAFLSAILPYLRMKKKEAELLVEFYALGSSFNPEERLRLMREIRAAKNRECLTTETLDGSVMDKQTHAYIAGVVDGEGCISAVFAPSGKPMLCIKVVNNHKPLIDFLVRLYGGWYATRKAEGNTKEAYTWELTKNSARETFLLQTLPYLRIKRHQAKLALQYVRLAKDVEREVRVKMCQSIRVLNRPKIQPDLIGNYESASAEMLTA